MVIDLVTIQPLKSLLQWSSPMVGASEVTIGAGLSLATLQALSAFSKVEVQWVPRQRSPWRILEMGEKNIKNYGKIMAKHHKHHKKRRLAIPIIRWCSPPPNWMPGRRTKKPRDCKHCGSFPPSNLHQSATWNFCPQ
jgi:hypothetical protein